MKSQLERVRQFHQAFNLEDQGLTPTLHVMDETVTDGEETSNADDLLKWALILLNDIKVTFKRVKNPDIRILRMRLLIEEFTEYMEAEHDNDLVQIADALGDILYIVNGTAVAYGLPMDDMFDDIHDNNMTKLGDDGKPIVINGKVIKPLNYKPVDLSKYFVIPKEQDESNPTNT